MSHCCSERWNDEEEKTKKPPAYLLDRFYDHIEKDREQKLSKQEFMNRFRREQERKNLLPKDGKEDCNGTN